MIKKNKWALLITSLVILLPIVVGLVFWEELPERMVTHWGVSGEADGWSNRSVAVFAMPLFLFVCHWVCVLCTARDDKYHDISKKVFRVVIWICPIVSIATSGVIYFNGLGSITGPNSVMYVMVGFLFVILGNYLPKCKQNFVIGIRVKWAMENEENWNATHRFAGKIWMIGGVLTIACLLFPEPISLCVFLSIVVVLLLLSVGYSYYYYTKTNKHPIR